MERDEARPTEAEAEAKATSVEETKRPKSQWKLRAVLYALAIATALQQHWISGRRFRLAGGTPEEQAVWKERVHDYFDSLTLSLFVAMALVVAFGFAAIKSARRDEPHLVILDCAAILGCLAWAFDTFMTQALSFT